MNNELMQLIFSQGKKTTFKEIMFLPTTTILVRITTGTSTGTITTTMQETIVEGTTSTLLTIIMASKGKIDNHPNNGRIPTNNNNNIQYADINLNDDSQNSPNNDGSYYNGNQEVNQRSQVNENDPPIQFNVMLLDSYDSTQNVQV